MLADARYLSLTTFRRDGSAVATPVWFAEVGEGLVARTDARSAKVRRLRRDPRVLVAPCTRDGSELGPHVPGRARVVERSAARAAYRSLIARYGVGGRVYDVWWRRVRRTPVVLLEITLDD